MNKVDWIAKEIFLNKCRIGAYMTQISKATTKIFEANKKINQLKKKNILLRIEGRQP